jgi:gluconolactonase
MPDNSGPDGIKVDSKGNVYSGVGDGVAVWDKTGELLGKILIEGGAGNLGFGEKGVLWVMRGYTLFRVGLSESVVGAS